MRCRGITLSLMVGIAFSSAVRAESADLHLRQVPSSSGEVLYEAWERKSSPPDSLRAVQLSSGIAAPLPRSALRWNAQKRAIALRVPAPRSARTAITVRARYGALATQATFAHAKSEIPLVHLTKPLVIQAQSESAELSELRAWLRSNSIAYIEAADCAEGDIAIQLSDDLTTTNQCSTVIISPKASKEMGSRNVSSEVRMNVQLHTSVLERIGLDATAQRHLAHAIMMISKGERL